MSPDTRIPSVLLGSGGRHPAVRVLTDDSYSTEPLLELPEGHSAYALAMRPAERLIVTGARTGDLYVSRWPPPEGTSDPGRSGHMTVGAPVLSVCIVDELHVVSADAAGRCLVWSTDDLCRPPESLTVEEGPVCALTSLPGDRLAGLTAHGRLLLWQTDNWRLMESPGGPPPPPLFALVKLCFWPAQNALVHPAVKGKLAAWHLGESTVRIHEAHRGDFYVCTVAEDVLCTVGKEDGVAKAWSDARGATLGEWKAPCGVISGEFLATHSEQIVLVMENGEAAVYSMGADGLDKRYQIEGEDHRVASGPSALERQEILGKDRAGKAQELVAEIIEKLSGGEFDRVDGLHGRLNDLGYERVSLGLRARQARQQGDLIAELRYRRQLYELLQKDDRRSEESLRCYARLLDGLWQFEEARRIGGGTLGTDEGTPETAWRARVIDLIEGDDWVAAPDVDVDLLIQAAEVLEKPFAGRWAIDCADPLVHRDGSLSARSLTDRYERVKQKHFSPSLPRARVRALWWISRGTVTQAETILFDEDSGAETPCAQLAFRVASDAHATVVAPAVLLDAGINEPSRDAVEHNQAAKRIVSQLSQSADHPSWIDRVGAAMRMALRQLHSEALSEKHGKETLHA